MNAGPVEAVVIGAGLAGLAAAYRLQQAGVRVCVLEASAGPGGRVQTVADNGYLFDTGADALTDGYSEYLSLLDALGLRDCLVPLPSTVGFVRRGRIVHVDVTRSWSMAASPFLSLLGKVRFSHGYRKVAAKWVGHDIANMHRLAALDREDTSAEALSLAAFGREVTDRLIDPMVRALGGSGVRGASWVEVVSGLGIANQSTYCLRGGQAVLPKALAAQLDVRYGHRVTALTEQTEGVSVQFQTADGSDGVLHARGGILATMYEAACEIYPGLATLSPNYGQSLQHIKLGKVQLGYSAPTRSRAYVIQVPTIEEPDVMLVFLDHNKCDDRAPPGHSLITVYSETGAADRCLPLSDEALTSWARGHAERWFPELGGHFVTSRVTRWPLMAPAGTPGQYARAAALLERMPAPGARIQIACDVFTKTSQEAAAHWGANAARNLLPALGVRQPTPNKRVASVAGGTNIKT